MRLTWMFVAVAAFCISQVVASASEVVPDPHPECPNGYYDMLVSCSDSKPCRSKSEICDHGHCCKRGKAPKKSPIPSKVAQGLMKNKAGHQFTAQWTQLAATCRVWKPCKDRSKKTNRIDRVMEKVCKSMRRIYVKYQTDDKKGNDAMEARIRKHMPHLTFSVTCINMFIMYESLADCQWSSSEKSCPVAFRHCATTMVADCRTRYGDVDTAMKVTENMLTGKANGKGKGKASSGDGSKESSGDGSKTNSGDGTKENTGNAN